MTELHRALAANLKALRQRLHWSQAELAERAGLSVSYVGDIETAVKWPAADKIDQLAAALHVRPYQLFLEPGDAADYQAWLERRDLVQEMGEKLIRYFENQRP